jgi:hypothetical protein
MSSILYSIWIAGNANNQKDTVRCYLMFSAVSGLLVSNLLAFSSRQSLAYDHEVAPGSFVLFLAQNRKAVRTCAETRAAEHSVHDTLPHFSTGAVTLVP